MLINSIIAGQCDICNSKQCVQCIDLRAIGHQDLHNIWKCDVCNIKFCGHFDPNEAAQEDWEDIEDPVENDQDNDFNKFCTVRCKKVYYLIPQTQENK